MHPMHLHRHSFELVRFAGKPTSTIIKDVVNVPRWQRAEVAFVAGNPGHQELGLMMRVKRAARDDVHFGPGPKGAYAYLNKAMKPKSM